METLKRNLPLIIISVCFFCYFIYANRHNTDELLDYKKDALKSQEIAIKTAIVRVDSCFSFTQKKIDSISRYTSILSRSIQIIKAKTHATIIKIHSASHAELLRDLDSLRSR